MTLIIDAGALIAIERGQPRMRKLLANERAGGRVWSTHGGVVGQVWRSPARQVALAHVLRATKITPLDARLGRDAGTLLAQSGTSDVVDAALVVLARDGDEIATSDPDDISHLVAVAGLDVTIRVV